MSSISNSIWVSGQKKYKLDGTEHESPPSSQDVNSTIVDADNNSENINARQTVLEPTGIGKNLNTCKIEIGDILCRHSDDSGEIQNADNGSIDGEFLHNALVEGCKGTLDISSHNPVEETVTTVNKSDSKAPTAEFDVSTSAFENESESNTVLCQYQRDIESEIPSGKDSIHEQDSSTTLRNTTDSETMEDGLPDSDSESQDIEYNYILGSVPRSNSDTECASLTESDAITMDPVSKSDTCSDVENVIEYDDISFEVISKPESDDKVVESVEDDCVNLCSIQEFSSDNENYAEIEDEEGNQFDMINNFDSNMDMDLDNYAFVKKIAEACGAKHIDEVKTVEENVDTSICKLPNESNSGNMSKIPTATEEFTRLSPGACADTISDVCDQGIRSDITDQLNTDSVVQNISNSLQVDNLSNNVGPTASNSPSCNSKQRDLVTPESDLERISPELFGLTQFSPTEIYGKDHTVGYDEYQRWLARSRPSTASRLHSTLSTPDPICYEDTDSNDSTWMSMNKFCQDLSDSQLPNFNNQLLLNGTQFENSGQRGTKRTMDQVVIEDFNSNIQQTYTIPTSTITNINQGSTPDISTWTAVSSSNCMRQTMDMSNLNTDASGQWNKPTCAVPPYLQNTNMSTTVPSDRYTDGGSPSMMCFPYNRSDQSRAWSPFSVLNLHNNNSNLNQQTSSYNNHQYGMTYPISDQNMNQYQAYPNTGMSLQPQRQSCQYAVHQNNSWPRHTQPVIPARHSVACRLDFSSPVCFNETAALPNFVSSQMFLPDNVSRPRPLSANSLPAANIRYGYTVQPGQQHFMNGSEVSQFSAPVNNSIYPSLNTDQQWNTRTWARSSTNHQEPQFTAVRLGTDTNNSVTMGTNNAVTMDTNNAVTMDSSNAVTMDTNNNLSDNMSKQNSMYIMPSSNIVSENVFERNETFASAEDICRNTKHPAEEHTMEENQDSVKEHDHVSDIGNNKNERPVITDLNANEIQGCRNRNETKQTSPTGFKDVSCDHVTSCSLESNNEADSTTIDLSGESVTDNDSSNSTNIKMKVIKRTDSTLQTSASSSSIPATAHLKIQKEHFTEIYMKRRLGHATVTANSALDLSKKGIKRSKSTQPVSKDGPPVLIKPHNLDPVCEPRVPVSAVLNNMTGPALAYSGSMLIPYMNSIFTAMANYKRSQGITFTAQPNMTHYQPSVMHLNNSAGMTSNTPMQQLSQIPVPIHQSTIQGPNIVVPVHQTFQTNTGCSMPVFCSVSGINTQPQTQTMVAGRTQTLEGPRINLNSLPLPLYEAPLRCPIRPLVPVINYGGTTPRMVNPLLYSCNIGYTAPSCVNPVTDHLQQNLNMPPTVSTPIVADSKNNPTPTIADNNNPASVVADNNNPTSIVADNNNVTNLTVNNSTNDSDISGTTNTTDKNNNNSSIGSTDNNSSDTSGVTATDKHDSGVTEDNFNLGTSDKNIKCVDNTIVDNNNNNSTKLPSPDDHAIKTTSAIKELILNRRKRLKSSEKKTINIAPANTNMTIQGMKYTATPIVTEGLVTYEPIPEACVPRPAPDPKKTFKARHFNFSRLTIGDYQYACDLRSFEKTARLKVLFKKRVMIYEFQLTNQDISTSSKRQMAEITVPFDTIVGLWLYNKEMILEVDTAPRASIGSKGIERNSGNKLCTAMVYDRNTSTDFTQSQVAKSPYHYVQFRTVCAEKIRAELSQFDPRFAALTRQTLIKDMAKTLEKGKRPITSHLLDPSIHIPTNKTNNTGVPVQQSVPNNPVNVQQLVSCGCTGGCSDSSCQCCVKGVTCTEGVCGCVSCRNPLNVLHQLGLPAPRARTDPCLMENIYQINRLDCYVQTPMTLECCQIPVLLLECIPGEKRCPNCHAAYKYSWCTAQLCSEVDMPRNHCLKCGLCTDYRNSHCSTCNVCYFSGQSKTFKCPICHSGTSGSPEYDSSDDSDLAD